MTPHAAQANARAAASSSDERTSKHHLRTECRACGGRSLRPFLSLGPQPLANAFLRGPAEIAAEARYPLDVYFCETCSLVQLLDVIDPETLFGHYVYVTGTSETMARHNTAYADAVCDEMSLRPNDLVVEIASNDGSLLTQFARRGVRTVGVEPARNIAAMAQERGIETVCRFFHSAAAVEIREAYGPAKVVIGNNVLAHVDETRDFLAGTHTLLTDDGRVVVEVPYAREMLERTEYDTIYHEHLCYFAVSPLARMGESVGLCIVRVDRMPVHGGTIRVWFAKGREHAPAVRAMMEEERAIGLTTFGAWEGFGRAAERQRAAMRALLADLRRSGQRLAGYGAPAKGNTLLNYCGIGTDDLPFTVDRNPLKVGTLTPGMHIPVLPVEALIERHPDAVVILAWNFAEEIIRQQQQYAASGGRFILPIPLPRFHAP